LKEGFFETITIFLSILSLRSCGPAGLLYAYVGEFHDNIRRPRSILSVTFLCSLAGLLIPAIAFWIIPGEWDIPLPWGLPTLTSWRVFMAVCGLPSLAAATILKFAMPESPKFLLEKGDYGNALKVFRRIFMINTRKPGSEYPVSIHLKKLYFKSKSWDQVTKCFIFIIFACILHPIQMS
jgi:hypothetical protein